jgi:trigger factor
VKVTVERMPESQVLLNIEIDPERVETSMNQAYRRIAPRANVPGFRPGKAPRAILERHYGRQMLLNEALDKLVPEVVEEAIKAESLDIVGMPSLEIASFDPVVVKATVPVRPTVELGDYRALRVAPEPVVVDAAKVDEQLEELRERYATVEPVERPVEDGDVVRADVRATVDGEPIYEEEDAELTVSEEELERDGGLPGLYARLIGMSAGDVIEFDHTVPEDATDGDRPHGLRGETIHYTVALKDVKTRVLPELDDEFAKEVGESFPTLAALRERLESDLRASLETEAERKLDEQALDALVAQAQIEFPPQLVEREIDRVLHEQFIPGDDHRAFERTLRHAGVSEDSLKEMMRPSAVERVKRSLVLNRLRELEGITVTAEDVSAEIDRMSEGLSQSAEFRRIFDTETGRESIERTLLTRRTLERLRQIVRGEAPPLPEPPTTAEQPPVPDAAGQEVEQDQAAVSSE